jgi:Rad3-related DNA helicase
MSATILDVDSFIKTLGINEDVKFIQVDSTFPVENRKLYVTNSGKMSYGSIDKTLSKMAEDLKKILEFHKEEKGIIHTHSYKISKYIQDNIHDERLCFHDASSRADVLQQHIASPNPTVLVSPSMKEGIDLYDELARFCVIVKLPYPSLGDKQIKKRMEKDSRWYRWQTALAIVQASGRGIRHEEDYCTIYIMDSGIKYFIKQNESMFPKYFLNAIMN